MTARNDSAATTVSVGDIRFVRALDGGTLSNEAHARLVLVLDYLGPHYVLVSLVTEDAHMAGPADVVLTQLELHEDLLLCAQVDLAATLPTAQLGELVATLDTSVLDVVKEAYETHEFPAGPVADSLGRGLPLGSPADPRWQFKLIELDDLHRLQPELDLD